MRSGIYGRVFKGKSIIDRKTESDVSEKRSKASLKGMFNLENVFQGVLMVSTRERFFMSKVP